ncbi:MAG: hypothetical protein VR65_25645 [Desulfobulbaceae bacterium BRH_c16a]|nr:MAG: hypothetical protein VR65_25645 [Desulfobulbaceae bacterium BRH_c16a]
MGFLARQEEFVFLDTSRPDHENVESLLFVKPLDRLICRGGDDLLGYLETLQQRLTDGFYLAGWVGYEFGAMLEGGIDGKSDLFTDAGVTLADLGVFLKPLRFDHHTGENNFPFDSSRRLIQDGYAIKGIHANMAKQEFIDALNVVRLYIGAGDTYQVNYTMKLLFGFDGSPESLYKVLRRNQSVAYGAYIRNKQERTLSFSPELFFRKKGAEITARPMKGTAPRGRNSREESSNTVFLHNDIKNRSENVMIVDLVRNDLGRLMHGRDRGRSRVFVDSLFDVESYESLLQMTSTVKATTTTAAMQNLSLTELFRALFPCGSITGAPKIRTMQIIDELEKSRRGVYTGAIGYFGPDGSAVFNVPIRTVRLQGEVGEMGIGAGITYDSVPEEEWCESLLKGRFLTHSQPEFQLFETMLWQHGQGYRLLEEHLQRLEDGAKFFKFSCSLDLIRNQLKELEKNFSDGFFRVRLVLAKDGQLSHTSSRCGPPLCLELSPEPGPVVEKDLPVADFFERPVDTKAPWCFHKTTMRSLYDNAFEKAQADGLYDFLFVNEQGEVTEGCITNIIIYAAGHYATPPVSCGLLSGIMRGVLLADKAVPVFEKVLTEQDVRGADAVFLCNSVRGIIRVRMR